MADKRKLHHRLVLLRRVNPWILFALFLISGLIAISSLRSNNLHMIELREQVFAADEKGEGVEEALDNLTNLRL